MVGFSGALTQNLPSGSIGENKCRQVSIHHASAQWEAHTRCQCFPMATKLKVIIIGGGPSGLATLKFLAVAHHFYPDIQPVDVQLFEAEDRIGGTFSYRVWKDAEVSSPRPLTHRRHPLIQGNTARSAGLVEISHPLLRFPHLQRCP